MFIGKFAQRSNLTKVKMVGPKEFFDLLHSSEFEVSDARLVNDDTVEVHYKSVGEFAEQNDKVIKSMWLLLPLLQPMLV